MNRAMCVHFVRRVYDNSMYQNIFSYRTTVKVKQI